MASSRKHGNKTKASNHKADSEKYLPMRWQALESLEPRQLLSATVTADITDVAPDPRHTPVSSISIVFNKAVAGFALADLSLARGATSVPMAGPDVTLTSSDQITWTLAGLTALTGAEGAYTLSLADAGAPITNTASGDTMAAGAVSDVWTMDTTAPTAGLSWGAPVAGTSVSNMATIVFSQAVTGFDLTKLSLTKGATPVDLTGAILTTSDNVTFTLTGLVAKAGAAGAYTLKITAATAGVSDLAGNAMAVDAASTAFTVAAATPKISAVATDSAATEAVGNAGTITLYRTGPVDHALTVGISMGGSAINGKDYAAVAKSATFAIGSATATVTVTPTNDAAAEADKAAVLYVQAGSGYTVDRSKATARVNIADSSPTTSIAVKDGAATEAGHTGVFTVTRTGSTSGDLVVKLSLQGTAVKGEDYNTAIVKTVTIPSGQASVDVTITPTNDSVAEVAKYVTATIQADTKYFVSRASHSAKIIIADSSPTISIAVKDGAATEAGHAGVFTVTRTGSTSGDLVVKLNTYGTAVNGKDYAAVLKTITIPSGQASADVSIAPTNDSVPEWNKNVTVSILPATKYFVSKASGKAQIIITDSSPTISIVAQDANGTEAGDPVVFRVSRTGPTTTNLVVPLNISGTARNGVNYNTIPATATIPIGSSFVDVTITPKSDGKVDPGNLSVLLSIRTGTTFLINPLLSFARGKIVNA